MSNTTTVETHAQTSSANQQEQLPTVVTAKIQSIRTSGPVLATATVNLNGCFAIRGVKIVNGGYGPFVSMPSYRSGEEFKDICFPCTKEFHDQLRMVVLDAYQQEIEQLSQIGQGVQGQGIQEPPFPEMTM